MELGSNFQLNMENLYECEDSIYTYLGNFNALYFDSGRSALRYLMNYLKQISGNEGLVLLPSYICDSVIDVFELKNIRYYRIKKDLNIDIGSLEQAIDGNVRIVYLMHYFGALQSLDILERILELKRNYGFTIIEDTTHSIFTNVNTIGDFCVCSLRKWFPIPNGGVLYTKQFIQNPQLKRKNSVKCFEAMLLKHLFIEEGLECNAMYRKKFVEEEEGLDEQKEVYGISTISEQLLKCFSISTLCLQRQENYHKVSRFLSKNGVTPMIQLEGGTALCCPIYVENRDELKKFLMEHKIYCATHWPISEKIDNMWKKEAEEMSNHMISLPIDQRYKEQEIAYLEGILELYWKEEHRLRS